MISGLSLKNKILICMLFISYTTILICTVPIYNIFQEDLESKMIDSYDIIVNQVCHNLSYVYLDMIQVANTLSSDDYILENLQLYDSTYNDIFKKDIQQNIENNIPQSANNYTLVLETIICTNGENLFYSGAQGFFHEYDIVDILNEDWFFNISSEYSHFGLMDSSQMFDKEENPANFYVVRTLTDRFTGRKVASFRMGFSNAFVRYKIENIVSDSTTSYIINSDGYILSSNSPDDIGTYLSIDIVSGLSSGTHFEIGDSFVLHAPIQNTPWTVAVLVPSDSLNINTSHLAISIVLIVVASFFLASLLAYLLASSITIPVNTLIDKVKCIQVKGLNQTETAGEQQDEMVILTDVISHMTCQIDEMMDNLKEKEREKAEAEVKFLRTQITPHFLHNTLKTLPFLIKQGRNDENTSIITGLASLLKAGMSGDSSMIPLYTELALLRDYLVIMQIRYDYSFDFSIEECDDLADMLIPRLTLQPLLENAVFHGINELASEFLYIKLQIKYWEENNDYAHITILDNGRGIEQGKLLKINNIASGVDTEASDAQSIGIPNISKRLKYYYKDYQMNFESQVGKGTSVNIIIPIIKE